MSDVNALARQFAERDIAASPWVPFGRGVGNQLAGVLGLLQNPRQAWNALLDIGQQAARDPVGTGRQFVAGEVDRLREAAQTPQGMMQYIGENYGPGRLTGRAGRPVIREMTTYHGTPHRFEPTPDNPLGAFDHAKMGTGEGVQAYGWGTYLAEKPAVAQQYRQMAGMSDDAAAFLMPEGAQDEIRQLMRQAYDAKNSAAADVYDELLVGDFGPDIIERNVRGWEDPAEVAAGLAALQQAKAVMQKHRGSLYTVDLPDEQIAQMLDWDTPVGDDLLRRVAEKSVADGQFDGSVDAALALLRDEWDSSGAKLYQGLSEQLGSDRAASEFLRALGMPGIRYLDGASRGRTGGSRNFVVFDPAVTRILARE